MSHYSIKELETLSGIKAHTIRIWEQRYGILRPARTLTNIRTYSDKELKDLLNISLLNRNGIKISKLAKMSKEEVTHRVLNIFESNPTYENLSEALIMAMVDFDEEKFERLLDQHIHHFGFESAFSQIVFPFLQRLGILWQTEIIKVSQEHFVSNLVRQKIITAIDGIKMQNKNSSRSIMLFLPEGEMHELSLLFMNYLARKRGYHTLYLGANVPLEDIITCHEDYKPDFIFAVITTYPPQEEALEYVNNITAKFQQTSFILTGNRAISLGPKLPQKVQLLRSIEDAIQLLDKL